MSWAEVKMAVKSIQRGYTTITSSDVTITLGKSVDPDRCIVLLDGFCGMYSYNSSGVSRGPALMKSNPSLSIMGYENPSSADRGLFYNSVNFSNEVQFPYASVSTYSAARKPYVKALTETQLTIGQSGTYSAGSNGTTVSYQIIEFFN
ncbi:MAG: hypothetical protein ACI4E1_07815 [Lachnospira sp.]